VVGHNYHFHIRISCPKDSTDCKAQPIPPTDEGCGKDLDWWFTKKLAEPKPSVNPKPILMSALPPACKLILKTE
jgi:penicillin-insensitive murein endopeptidase